ncbi:MAG: ribosome maturation factor RimP [Actinomycetes bacterium]
MSRSPRDTRDRAEVLTVIEPVVVSEGMDLEDVEVTPAGRRRVLRVVVDADGGVGLDAVARVSTAVSEALDAADAMSGTPYVLEVTSPGVDRPLTQPRHWRRALDRLVTVDVAGEGAVTGRVVQADDAGVVLDLPEGRREVAYADLGGGRVQVEFRRHEGGAS